MYGRRKVLGEPKKLSKTKKQNIKKPFISEENKEKIKNRMIRNILTFFDTEEEEEEERKKLMRKKKS